LMLWVTNDRFSCPLHARSSPHRVGNSDSEPCENRIPSDAGLALDSVARAGATDVDQVPTGAFSVDTFVTRMPFIRRQIHFVETPRIQAPGKDGPI
jgi:hypothetical protein